MTESFIKVAAQQVGNMFGIGRSKVSSGKSRLSAACIYFSAFIYTGEPSKKKVVCRGYWKVTDER